MDLLPILPGIPTLPAINDIGPIAHVIQLSVAPVFLLTGIGSILNVMTNRLSRVIDRARILEVQLDDASAAQADTIRAELRTLDRRATFVGQAITLCTMTALLVSSVVAILFTSAFLPFDVTLPVALLFILAMGSFSAGLLMFLREIYVGTRNRRIRTH